MSLQNILDCLNTKGYFQKVVRQYLIRELCFSMTGQQLIDHNPLLAYITLKQCTFPRHVVRSKSRPVPTRNHVINNIRSGLQTLSRDVFTIVYITCTSTGMLLVTDWFRGQHLQFSLCRWRRNEALFVSYVILNFHHFKFMPYLQSRSKVFDH